MDTNYQKKLSGIFPPCMTIFNDDESIDYDGIIKNIEMYNTTKLRGYMPLGSNGEFRALTDKESVKVMEVYGKYTPADKTIIAGVMRESAYATIEFIKQIADKRVDFATVLCPHYFAKAMTDDALFAYYTQIANESPIPVMMYNAPKFAANIVFSPDLITRLAPHPNIAGMKDTSGEDIGMYVNAVPDGSNFYVMPGTINKMFKGLQLGTIGGVVSMANYLPDQCVKLQELYESGQLEEAAAYDVYVRELSSNAAGKHGVAGVKAAMDLLGYAGGKPRLPLMALNDEKKAALKAALEQEGLL
ncbi:dihydrodipicolinate synthase family protein [candidate division KSB3 bacterium]|uniref:Dihydrodipicolinate synthase family protein n=1 Tax=candidate division KSB3 bacterium TaxID=2044937 RepID=A0A2G6KMF0_9BACT|nr:MAG: dihydrodipicolinate synthase family protein [candidate division KSB3 bacterium]